MYEIIHVQNGQAVVISNEIFRFIIYIIYETAQSNQIKKIILTK